jgi:hypothetical protein
VILSSRESQQTFMLPSLCTGPWYSKHDDPQPPRRPPQIWAELDPRATNFTPAAQLGCLISELDPPLGVKGEEAARAKLQSIVMSVDIPVHGGKVGGRAKQRVHPVAAWQQS